MDKLMDAKKIIQNIEEQISILKNKDVRPEFIIMGHMHYYTLKSFADQESGLFQFAKVDGYDSDQLCGYKKIQIIIDGIKDTNGTIKDRHFVLRVVGQ